MAVKEFEFIVELNIQKYYAWVLLGLRPIIITYYFKLLVRFTLLHFDIFNFPMEKMIWNID
jgi:hypothetical protein